MKTIVIFFGLLFASSASSEENPDEEDPMTQNFSRSYDMCVKIMNPTTDTLKDVVKGRNLDSRDGNCFRACILNGLGIIEDAKANFQKAEEFLKSGKEDVPSVDELLERMKTECQENAESSEDECIVTESYLKCFIKIRNEIVKAKRGGDDLSYDDTIL